MHFVPFEFVYNSNVLAIIYIFEALVWDKGLRAIHLYFFTFDSLTSIYLVYVFVKSIWTKSRCDFFFPLDHIC